MGIKGEICFICGGENPDSMDHLPPKNLFLNKYRKLGNGLITVPCHIECNKESELDDEYFRYCLTIPAYWTSDKARELWDTKLKKQLHRSQSAGFLTYLRELLEEVNIIDEGGNPIAKADAALLDAKRIESVLFRVTKGLYFRQFKTRLPDSHPMELSFYDPTVAMEIVDQYGIRPKFESTGGGIFRHFYLYSNSEEEKGIWFFVFFNSVYFSVHLGDLPKTDNNDLNA